jgi:hypothetical protein
MSREEEEAFEVKEKHAGIDEAKINSIMERLELITKQVNLISDYLMSISPTEERWRLEKFHPYKNRSR